MHEEGHGSDGSGSGHGGSGDSGGSGDGCGGGGGDESGEEGDTGEDRAADDCMWAYLPRSARSVGSASVPRRTRATARHSRWALALARRGSARDTGAVHIDRDEDCRALPR